MALKTALRLGKTGGVDPRQAEGPHHTLIRANAQRGLVLRSIGYRRKTLEKI